MFSQHPAHQHLSRSLRSWRSLTRTTRRCCDARRTRNAGREPAHRWRTSRASAARAAAKRALTLHTGFSRSTVSASFSQLFVFATRRAQPASPLPLQPRGVRSTRGGRWIDLEQPKQALVQLGAAHSPQRSFEQASNTTAAGQQGRREVAPARQYHHARPPGCCRKQLRRSWSSQAAAARLPVRGLRI